MSVIYANNAMHLQKYYPGIYKILQQVSHRPGIIKLENAKNGALTAKYQKDNEQRPAYIHSRNNPVEEARRWVGDKLQDNCGHVIFYGFGCGYMVQALLEINPGIKISVYEPCTELFKLVIENRPVDRLIDPSNIEVLAVGESGNILEEFARQVIPKINTESQMLVLPSYRRIFADKVDLFQKKMLRVVKGYKDGLGMDAHAETFWTLNSLFNVRAVVNTPSIFDKKSEFENKPLVLVAAGPSLEYEYENLKYIHKNNMAYIFAVGSAIHAIIARGITPHAFCSYDPFPANEKLFANLKRDDYPLIFGSSIFSNTLKYHRSAKFHMIISQDTVNPFLLGTAVSRIINDAPSIAVCVLQLAYRLGCSPIILVGQDFAYPKSQIYARGAAVGRDERLTADEKKQVITVTGVDGSVVETSNSLNRMRESMETYLKQVGDRTVINTSPDGARIAGTIEQPLKLVIAEQLAKGSINPLWHENAQPNADKNLLTKNIALLNDAVGKFKTLLKECYNHLNNIARYRAVAARVNTEYQKITDKFNSMEGNCYYKTVIKPMVRAELQVLSKFTGSIAGETNPVKKAELIVQNYLNTIKKMEESLALTERIVKGLKEIS